MNISLSTNDPRIRWEGHAELKREGRWVMPRRLRTEGSNSFVHPELLRMADMAAGVRIDFKTDASGFRLEAETTMPAGLDEDVSPFDVVIDGRLTSRQTLRGDGVIEIAGIGRETKAITVWLPQFGITRLGTISLLDASFVSSLPAPRPHWIAYGSSITHCREAPGPSDTWPVLVAAELDWRLTALGFAGQCHLDPVVARQIRSTPADLISLCLGINIWAATSLSGRTLGPMLSGFVDTVREGHPSTPMVIMTPIASPEREHKRNEAGLTLNDVRSLVDDFARWRQGCGDAALAVVDGRDVLSEMDSHLLVDGLHPGPDGYRLLAHRSGPILAEARGEGWKANRDGT